jgi:site-specific DNA recombinase
MKPRAAIYARFSSHLQRDRSVEDQIALCREYAGRNGYDIVAVFADRAITGSSLLLRRGIHSMLRATREGDFQFVIAESLSRLARDQEDASAIRKRLDFAGVKIVTIADGIVSPLLHGLRTIIDSQYLDDLKIAVRRGMSGVIRDGRDAGGAIYGYRSVLGKPGELEIVPEQAKIIRRIFSEYVSGQVPRAIAAKLNVQDIPAPRKQYWRASTINGHTKRRTGILQNELYCGRIIWNRSYRLRDPDTGQRIWRYKPESEWQRSEAPHLRIIGDEVFCETQRLRALRACPHLRSYGAPKRIFSGLLRCGACGAGMSKKDTDRGRPRIICTRMQESRTCSNRRRYYVDEIERIVMRGLRDALGSQEAMADYVDCYNAKQRRLSAGSAARRCILQDELTELDRQVDRAVSAIIRGRITEEDAARHLPSLRKRRDEIESELAGIDAPPRVASLNPTAVETFLRAFKRKDEVIKSNLPENDHVAARRVRAIIKMVTVVPMPIASTPGIIVVGDLGSLLAGDALNIGRLLPDTALSFTLNLGGLEGA